MTLPTLELDIQIETTVTVLPHPALIESWIEAALITPTQNTLITVRIVDKEEMTALNEQFRKKTGPTNVLSFLYNTEDPDTGFLHLGDLVFCAPLIAEEAIQHSKDWRFHWAHLMIHGTLHIQGYDHQKPEEAAIMESLEIKLLNDLGFPNPY